MALAAAGDVDPFAPTSAAGVQAFLHLADTVLDMGPDSVFWDIGCGDAGLLVAVHNRFQCPCVGIERDDAQAEAAYENVKREGLTKNITILKTDARNHSALYAGATHVYMYLEPPTMEEVIPLLDRRSMLVSRIHPIPPSLAIRQRKQDIGGEVFYLVTP